MPPSDYKPFFSSSIFSDFVSYSPLESARVNFFDCFQVSPPQSTTVGMLYRIEIKEYCFMGEAGIKFEDLDMDYMFPSLFEEALASDLKGCYAYVCLTREERESADVQRYKHRFWRWSPNSRYFAIFLTNFADNINLVVRFDLKTKTYEKVRLDKFPTGEDFTKALEGHFPEMFEPWEPLIKPCNATDRPHRPARAVREETQAPRKPLKEPVAPPPASEYKPKAQPGRNTIPPMTYPEQAPVQPSQQSATPANTPAQFETLDSGQSAKPASGTNWTDIILFLTPTVVMALAVFVIFVGSLPIGTAVLFGLGGAAVGAVMGALWLRAMKRRSRRVIAAYLAMGNVAGVNIRKFTSVLGRPASTVPCRITDRSNVPGYLVTWSGYRYLVTILFDGNYNCISIKGEVLPGN